VQAKKKADVAKHPEVLDNIGLLNDSPSGTAGLLFIQSSENFDPFSPMLRFACKNAIPVKYGKRQEQYGGGNTAPTGGRAQSANRLSCGCRHEG
jgi:hypothetical protein